MRTRQVLVRVPDLAVFHVRCDERAAGWSPPEPSAGYGAIFVRRGTAEIGTWLRSPPTSASPTTRT